MKLKRNIKFYLLTRWSYVVTFLCYFTLFLLIWTLSMPLRPNTKIEEIKNFKKENTFEIRLKNSNFNSDNKLGQENKLLNEKNEYLVNANNKENRKKNPATILKDVFVKADKNKDELLDSRELSEWIRKKIVEHISQAVSNNYGLFLLIDVSPKNGVVSWKEYHSYFLKQRGFTSRYVKGHNEKKHVGMKKSIKEQIMKDKATWREAAKSNPDALTVDEFLSFTHPESSAANQLALVDELYDKFDRDGDELLTEEEFAVFQTEGNNDETVVVRQDENQRRAEFRNIVDLNGDGKADRRELLHYIAPQSPRHSEHEAEALLSLADSDHDNCLSLDEILAHPDLFLNSKMVNSDNSFHDEF